jgi:Thoeris protein ThsB, TIR-like domain
MTSDNPFKLPLASALGGDPKFVGLLDLIAYPQPVPPAGLLGSLAGLGQPAPSSALASLIAPSPLAPFGALSGFGSTFTTPPSRPYALPLAPPPKPKPVAPDTVRRAFFSFHHDDIMRVNNVRQAWKIDHPDSAENRSFRDSSLWEARKLESPDAIKNVIRAGVLYTSAVCVLIGTMTWERQWVRYEIARAVIDGRGLLAVNLNNLPHHRTKTVHPRGLNPLAHMGIAKLQHGPLAVAEYFLCEMWFESDGRGGQVENWALYKDYALAVKKPAWLRDPDIGYVTPLSADAAEYDYVLDNGHRNIGSWIDKAAKQAGR